jgi:hypothetical protein
MKTFSTRAIVGFIGAVLVFSVGFWYARSDQSTASPTNSTASMPTEKQCARQVLPDHIAAADLILSGEVFVVLPDEPNALVYIKPLTVYKGTPPAQIIIRATAATATAGGTGGNAIVILPNGTKESELHFASGQPPYLLFLRGSDNKFITSRCDGSRLLGGGLTAEESAVLVNP